MVYHILQTPKKKWSEIEMVSGTFRSKYSFNKHNATKNENQNDKRCTFCNAQTEKYCILVLEMWHCASVLAIFEEKRKVSEKFLNVTNITLHEDFVLFGNTTNVLSDEIFGFKYNLQTSSGINVKRNINILFVCICKAADLKV